jgi:hypothetical protein
MAGQQTKYISDQTKRRNLMKTQQLQNTSKNVQGTIGNYWLWLGFGLLLIVAALAIQNVSRTKMSVPVTGSSSQPQSVPDAAARGVADYIRAHSNPSAQAVPEASVQSVADYLQMHSSRSAQAVPDAAVQSVTDYIRLHSSEQSANQNNAHIPSYRFQLDACSDVGLSELASCRKASQKTTP